MTLVSVYLSHNKYNSTNIRVQLCGRLCSTQ